LVAEDIGTKGFSHTEYQATEHRARNTADPTQYRSGKGFKAYQETCVGVDHAVLHADQHRSNGCQGSTDHEGQRNHVVGVDTQQVGHFHVFGTGAAGAAHT